MMIGVEKIVLLIMQTPSHALSLECFVLPRPMDLCLFSTLDGQGSVQSLPLIIP
jgi:hypothetical protein